MTRKFHVVALVAALFCAPLLVGCPDNGIVKDGLIIIDDIPGLSVKALWDGFVSFICGGDSPFEIGDIIIASAEGGFLRRIAALGEDAEEILSETEFCSLSEAVENGLMTDNLAFTSVDFQSAGLPLINGTRIIDLSGTDIYRDYGVAVVVKNGTLDCAPTINLAATWDNFRLSSFNMAVSGTIALNLDISVGVDNKTPLTFESEIIPPVVLPFATSIGPVPVYGAARLQFPFGVTGKFDGDTSIWTGFDASETFALGAAFDDGAWSSYSDFQPIVFNGHPLTWNIEVGADVTAYVKVVASVRLYEAVDLSVFAKPYARVDLDILPSPFTITLGGGLDFGLSYGIKILDWQILGDSYYWPGPYIDNTWTIEYSDPLEWTSGSWDYWNL
ncbi:MAG TPA: hypothetical protein PLO37_05620 [Candidatus Hydrogenedentes bacterium]|nr:hypothetical protein [Candidatus Hydrogenedentota bacterium]HPG66306.1 hypothetical protein [Candidatus Hydrogenedentota bacterium]